MSHYRAAKIAGTRRADLRQLQRLRRPAELEQTYKGRKFTLDGHLLGSVGEVLAETALKMRLPKMSAPVHDAVCNDRGDVQIKITAKRSIGIRHSCNHLIIFQVVSPSEAEILYDGPGNIVWENAGPMQSNGQRSISLKKIDGLRAHVHP